MFRPEPMDLIIIVVVALVLFGANRLPESARAIGQTLREFQNALAGKESAPTQPALKPTSQPRTTSSEIAIPNSPTSDANEKNTIPS